MAIDLQKQLLTQYSELQKKIHELEAGTCKAPDVKKLSSLLGIYKERDNSYMLRVRRTAGETSPQNLRDCGEVMERNGIDHGHFSTRQNIQFHGVPAANVERTILDFTARDMPFRGGGGNTFRNVATSPSSGVSATETFDTTSHTYAVWEWVYTYEKAYQFGRKFKLGFTSEERDDSNAGIQDLGFVPKIENGEQGFKVYGGGGMGRGASLGAVLFEFLPQQYILRASQAMIDLFHEHGNREVRAKARLRFVLQEIGEEAFIRLFNEYFDKADAPDYNHTEVDYQPQIDALKQFDEAAPSDAAYEGWKQRAVKPSKFDGIYSVRLFVRKGNFDAAAFRAFAELLETVGSAGIRVTIEQDAIVPLVHESALPVLYRLLAEKLPAQAVTSGRFEKHIVSCIGAASCPIGVLKAPEAAESVADALDELYDDYPELLDATYEGVLDAIRISGCASSCGLNLVAGLGFNGGKKRIDGAPVEVYQVHIGGQIDESNHQLALTDPEWIVPATQIGDFTTRIVRDYLDAYKGGAEQSLSEYTRTLREGFDPQKYLA